MRSFRQIIGILLMMIAFAAAAGMPFPEGILVGGTLFFLGLPVAPGRLSALLWSVCGFTLILYLTGPFIWMYEPDYFFSDLFFNICMGFLVVSLLLLTFRYAMLPVLFPRIYRYVIEGTPTLADIAPEKGRTVASLQEGVARKEINFLFGKADEELVKKWGIIAESIAALSKSRCRLACYVAGFLALWPLSVFLISGGMEGAMKRDLARMWETQPFRDGMVVSTPAAMNAAGRVFNEKRLLRGLTRQEALEWLGVERKNPAFKLGKPRYDHEQDETLLIFSDGRESLRLVAVYNDQGQIFNSWPEYYPTKLERDREE